MGAPSGGPTVDTILSEPHCRPGGAVAGKVHLRGGATPVEIRHVTMALMPRMDNPYGGPTAGPEVYRGALTRSFRLEPGQERSLSFSIPLPYELPFTTVLGRELPGFTIGLCTEVDAVGQPDPGDVDPISVEPLQSQQWVLAAVSRLGFKIGNVAFERAKLPGVSQQLPFYQQIRLVPPAPYNGRIGEVGLSFVASPRELAVVLAADPRSGHHGAGDEEFGRFRFPHGEIAEIDWTAKIGQWLEAAASRGPAHPPAHTPSPYGPPSPSHSPQPNQHGMLPPPGPSAPGAHSAPPGLAAPGGHGAGAAAAAYNAPGAPYGPGQSFPPPAPVPASSPMPGHTPPHGTPPHGTPPHGTPHGPGPSYNTPPPAYAPAPPPAHGPAPVHGGYPSGPNPYPPAAHPGQAPGHYPPPAPQSPPVYHGPPAYHGKHQPHWGAVAAAGGVAAAGVAGGLAAGAAFDAMGNAVGGAAAFAQDAAGHAVAGYVGNAAADVARGVAGEVANEVAGEVAGGIGEALGELLGGLFG
ncbi:sporulation protein [Actinomadura miaoliensis]